MEEDSDTHGLGDGLEDIIKWNKECVKGFDTFIEGLDTDLTDNQISAMYQCFSMGFCWRLINEDRSRIPYIVKITKGILGGRYPSRDSN